MNLSHIENNREFKTHYNRVIHYLKLKNKYNQDNLYQISENIASAYEINDFNETYKSLYKLTVEIFNDLRESPLHNKNMLDDNVKYYGTGTNFKIFKKIRKGKMNLYYYCILVYMTNNFYIMSYQINFLLDPTFIYWFFSIWE